MLKDVADYRVKKDLLHVRHDLFYSFIKYINTHRNLKTIELLNPKDLIIKNNDKNHTEKFKQFLQNVPRIVCNTRSEWSESASHILGEVKLATNYIASIGGR